VGKIEHVARLDKHVVDNIVGLAELTEETP
jgi:hypothetical protein